jgi:hypothetical protein
MPIMQPRLPFLQRKRSLTARKNLFAIEIFSPPPKTIQPLETEIPAKRNHFGSPDNIPRSFQSISIPYEIIPRA